MKTLVTLTALVLLFGCEPRTHEAYAAQLPEKDRAVPRRDEALLSVNVRFMAPREWVVKDHVSALREHLGDWTVAGLRGPHSYGWSLAVVRPGGDSFLTNISFPTAEARSRIPTIKEGIGKWRVHDVVLQGDREATLILSR